MVEGLAGEDGCGFSHSGGCPPVVHKVAPSGDDGALGAGVEGSSFSHSGGCPPVFLEVPPIGDVGALGAGDEGAGFSHSGGCPPVAEAGPSGCRTVSCRFTGGGTAFDKFLGHWADAQSEVVTLPQMTARLVLRSRLALT